jgi:hypothetical protein
MNFLLLLAQNLQGENQLLLKINKLELHFYEKKVLRVNN